MEAPPSNGATNTSAAARIRETSSSVRRPVHVTAAATPSRRASASSPARYARSLSRVSPITTRHASGRARRSIASASSSVSIPLPGYTRPKWASNGARAGTPSAARVASGSPPAATAMLEPMGISVSRRASQRSRRRTMAVTSSLAATTWRALVSSQRAAAREPRVASRSVWTVTTAGVENVARSARRRWR